MRRGAAPATVIASNAVLPFADMSQARDQEYFSDGLSEELLDVLAKISQLRVIGRTSSFQFKGKNEDLRVIAQKLDVDHLLEESVRKEGNISGSPHS
jgi:TolB-like protein